MGYLGTFADLPLGPVLVKASCGAQLGPSHVHPGPKEAITSCGLLVAPNRLPRASHRQCPTLVSTRSLPRGPEPTHPVASYTISEQDPVSFTNSISKGRPLQAPEPAEANSTLCGQHLHSSLYTVPWLTLTFSQAEGQSHAGHAIIKMAKVKTKRES